MTKGGYFIKIQNERKYASNYMVSDSAHMISYTEHTIMVITKRICKVSL